MKGLLPSTGFTFCLCFLILSYNDFFSFFIKSSSVRSSGLFCSLVAILFVLFTLSSSFYKLVSFSTSCYSSYRFISSFMCSSLYIGLFRSSLDELIPLLSLDYVFLYIFEAVLIFRMIQLSFISSNEIQ